jgi:hypothetical protein
MKIQCLHGYFRFQETRIGQVSDFMARFGFELVSVGDHYTFADLEDAPRYSLAGSPLLMGIPAIKTFEGEPWEVFEENGMVYNFALGLFVPIVGVLQKAEIIQAGNKFISSGLLLPGSITEDGEIVKDYAAWFSRDTLRFTYSEVGYV